MARIDFGKALRGELARQNDLAATSLQQPSGQGPAIEVAHESRASMARSKRPLWLQLLRSPLTIPRRFLVGALHLKLDGIIGRQQQEQNSLLLTLKQTADAVQAAFASTNVALAERFDRLQETMVSRNTAIIDRVALWEGMIGDRLHEIDIKSRGPHDYDDDTVAVRLNDGYVLVPKGAAKLRILLSDAPADGLEPGTTRLIRRLLSPGMTAIDVGANVGALTLTCARAVGPTGKVFSYEAEPIYADLLAKSFDLNGVPWVKLRRFAVSHTQGTATFHVSPIGGHSSLYPLPVEEQRREALITVDTCTLDQDVGPGQSIDLIKMDVEGAELDVLMGMQQLIMANSGLVIIAEFGRSHLATQGLSADAWLDHFRSSGFVVFVIDELTSHCRPAIAYELMQVDSVNLVMTKRRSQAYDILAQLS